MDDDGAGDSFCEEDIEQILERRTQVITVAQDSGSSFSKASFAHTENRSDIDVDDPDFWQKWARKAEIDTEIDKKELIMDTPRKRTQTRRFGNDESVMDISELETSSDSEDGGMTTRRGRPSRPRRGRHGDEEDPSYGSKWTKSDCIAVEKMLLTWGWGRWNDAVTMGGFRRIWTESDLEDCSRLIVLYCLQVYRGDDKIKAFIWDLIAPKTDDANPIRGNHVGLSSPVPRGRKSKKKKDKDREKDKPSTSAIMGAESGVADWSQDERYDASFYLDGAYKRHLNRQANKVLLRIRLLYYIKQEIIGPALNEIQQFLPVHEVPIFPPPCDLPPEPWWDADCDKSLIIGTYKHGYEKFIAMRLDPTLIFLSKLGPPDTNELLEEMRSSDAALDDVPDEEVEPEPRDEDDDEKSKEAETQNSEVEVGASETKTKQVKEESSGSAGLVIKWPTSADLNTRLRRLVTCYQRNYKREEQKIAARAKRLEKQGRMENLVREREAKRVEQQRRWTKREETEFFRVLSSFGLEYDKSKNNYDWDRFRHLAGLERKTDEMMNEYLRGFLAMCKRVTGQKLTEEEDLLQMTIEPIAEDRAKRLLNRLDLMSKLREDVLSRKDLLRRLIELPCPSSPLLPSWWIPAKHDRDLLIGVARYGFSRTDYYIVTDPTLAFKDVVQRYITGESLANDKEKRAWDKRAVKIKQDEDVALVKKTIETEKTTEKEPSDAKLASEDSSAITAELNHKETEKQVEHRVEKLDSEDVTKETASENKPETQRQTGESLKSPTKLTESMDADVAAVEPEDEEGVTVRKTEFAETEKAVDGERGTNVEDQQGTEAERFSDDGDKAVSLRKDESSPDHGPLSEIRATSHIEISSQSPLQHSPAEDEDDCPTVSADDSKQVEKTPNDAPEVSADAITELASVDHSCEKAEKMEISEVEECQDNDEKKVKLEDPSKDEKEVSLSTPAVHAIDAESPKAGNIVVKVEDEEDDEDENEAAKVDPSLFGDKEAIKRHPILKFMKRELTPEVILSAIVQPPDLPPGLRPKSFISPYSKFMDYRDGPAIQEFPSDSPMAHLLSQSYANPICWPRDRVTLWRVEALMEALEIGKWPTWKPDPLLTDDVIVGGQRVSTPDSITGLPSVPMPVNHDSAFTNSMFESSPAHSPSLTPRIDASLIHGGSPISITPISAASSSASHYFLGQGTSYSDQTRGNLTQSQLTQALRGVTAGGRASPSLQLLAQSGSSSSSNNKYAGYALSADAKRAALLEAETERLKLNAFLQMHTLPPSLSLTLSKPQRDATEDMTSVLSNALRRGTSSVDLAVAASGLMKAPPPPAHQSRSQSNLSSSRSSTQRRTVSASPLQLPGFDASSGSMDLTKWSSASKSPSPASSTSVGQVLGSAAPSSPMDLSGPSKSQAEEGGDNNLLLDLQARSKKTGSQSGGLSSLELTLSKIKKRKMEATELQANKRKKLDNIVKGLSAARSGGEAASNFSLFSGAGDSSKTEEVELTRKKNDEPRAALSLTDTSEAWNASLKQKPSEPSTSSRKDSKDKRLPHFGRANITITPIPPKASTSTSSAASATTQSSAYFQHRQDSKESKVHRWLEQMGTSPWDMQKIAKSVASSCNSLSQKQPHGSALRQRLNASPTRPATSSGTTASSSNAGTTSTSFDWNKMSGEENVPVLHRITGKKLVGQKAPQLKHLARWLLENPSYDVDPKWAEAMKSKGTLPESLAKQLSKETDLTQALLGQAAVAFPGLFGMDTTSKNVAAAAAAQQLNFPLGMAAAAAAGMNPLALSNPLFANLASFGMTGMFGAGDMPYSAFSATDMAAMAAAAGLTVPGLTPTPQPASKDKGSADRRSRSTSRSGRSGGISSSSSSMSRQDSKQAAAAAAALSQSTAAFPYLFPNPAAFMYPPLNIGSLAGFPGLSSATTTGTASTSNSYASSMTSDMKSVSSAPTSLVSSGLTAASLAGFPPGFAEAFASQQQATTSRSVSGSRRSKTTHETPVKTSAGHSSRTEGSLGQSTSSGSSPASAASPGSSAPRVGTVSPADSAARHHSSHKTRDHHHGGSNNSGAGVGGGGSSRSRSHSGKPAAEVVKKPSPSPVSAEVQKTDTVETENLQGPEVEDGDASSRGSGEKKRELRSSTSAQSAAVAPPPSRRSRRPSKPKDRGQSTRPKPGDGKLDKMDEAGEEESAMAVPLDTPEPEAVIESIATPVQLVAEVEEPPQQLLGDELVDAEREAKDSSGSHRRKREREPEPKLRSSSRTAAAVANVKMSSLVDTRCGLGSGSKAGSGEDVRKTDGGKLTGRKGHPSSGEDESVGSPKTKRPRTGEESPP
ncbi:unnamed protein product [Notodromas monacha]|uniref:BRK domain-containing protein n=1 Tax=Notodromas monacha TaxID=399045 RepID=A0A7R9BLC4_9CRUS|nr:unnamed protein product [Notodromas monacha]CAG0916765.1 unnamed protein product [Notodromas monacha]